MRLLWKTIPAVITSRPGKIMRKRIFFRLAGDHAGAAQRVSAREQKHNPQRVRNPTFGWGYPPAGISWLVMTRRVGASRGRAGKGGSSQP